MKSGQILLMVIIATNLPSVLHGQLNRWDTGEAIPGARVHLGGEVVVTYDSSKYRTGADAGIPFGTPLLLSGGLQEVGDYGFHFDEEGAPTEGWARPDVSRADLRGVDLQKIALISADGSGLDFRDSSIGVGALMRFWPNSQFCHYKIPTWEAEYEFNLCIGPDAILRSPTSAGITGSDFRGMHFADGTLAGSDRLPPGSFPRFQSNNIAPDGTVGQLRDFQPILNHPIPIQLIGRGLTDGNEMEFWLERDWQTRIVSNLFDADPISQSYAPTKIRLAMLDDWNELEPNTEFQLFDWEHELYGGRRIEVDIPAGSTWDLAEIYTSGVVTLLDYEGWHADPVDPDPVDPDPIDCIRSDVDCDGDVDMADLLDLLGDWTGSSAEGLPQQLLTRQFTGAQVPEPASCASSFFGAMLILTLSRKRRGAVTAAVNRR